MIDRWKAWHQVGARIDRTSNERHRAMLECVREVTLAFQDESQRVYLTSFSLRENRKGQLNGKAADQRSVLAILDRLKTNTNFGNLKLLDMRDAGGTSKEIAFSISFTYPPEEAAKPARPAPKAGASKRDG